MGSSEKSLFQPNTRVRILSWFDHAALIAIHRPGVELLGTVVRVQGAIGDAIVFVQVDGVGQILALRSSDIEGVDPLRNPVLSGMAAPP